MDYHWKEVIDDQSFMADKDQTLEITRRTINELNAEVSGFQFVDEEFEQIYKKFDPMQIERNLKQTV